MITQLSLRTLSCLLLGAFVLLTALCVTALHAANPTLPMQHGVQSSAPVPTAPPPCDFSLPGITSQCQRELAHHFAPHVFQNTRSASIRRDLITRFDFDGDFDPTNQRTNARNPAYDLSAHVYFVVIEGTTHRFVGYAFYHPEDYKAGFGHENDMEGIMLTISYPSNLAASHGEVLVMETLSHNNLYQYYNDPAIADTHQEPSEASETRDGAITNEGSHPVVQVEAKGHGVRHIGYYKPTQPMVKYVPSMRPVGEVPVGEVPAAAGSVIVAEYALEALQDSVLWERRRDPLLYMDSFSNWTGRLHEPRKSHQLLEAFHGAGVLKANPPWAWDDRDDPNVERGDWYLAPAYALASHLFVPGLTAAYVNDADYYVSHPLLEYAGNPSLDRQRASVVASRGSQASQASAPSSLDAIRSYEGADLREWMRSGDDNIALRGATGDEYLRVPVRLIDDRFSDGGTLAVADLWLPLGRRNAIRLRYSNPSGVPAVRATFVVARRDETEERRVSSTVLLVAASSRDSDAVATFDVDVTEAMVYNAEDDDIEGLYIVGVELELTADLGPWGAEALRAHLPASLRNQVVRFREVEGAEESIDVREISIIAGGHLGE